MNQGSRPPGYVSHGAPPEPPPAPPPEPTLLERAKAAPVTYGLAALDVLVFVIVERSHSSITSTDIGTLVGAGANEPLHVWAGEYWRLATYMFLHIGWMHLIWNIYASVGFCASVEQALGRWRFLAVYLVSGIAGGCVSAILNTAVSAGASGALFGIVGAALAIRRRQLGTFHAFFKDPGTRSTLINIGIWTAIGTTVLHMDNAAHFGGMFMGFALTWIVTTRSPRIEWVLFVLGFGALLVGAARPWWKPQGDALKKLTAYAAVYLEGEQGFPQNKARGLRFAKKACAAGSDLACRMEQEAR